jgi:type II restriction enzyme
LANIDFYRKHFGITSVGAAFDKFVETLANYFDAKYYVDWSKVLSNAKRHEKSFQLLSELCGRGDVKVKAAELFFAHPETIEALPILIACRRGLSISDPLNVSAMMTYSFAPNGATDDEKRIEAEHYAEFLVHSGLIDVFAMIQNAADFAIGVEVGLDSNGRKNRGGNCGIQAIAPVVESLRQTIPGLVIRSEAGFAELERNGFRLPVRFDGIVWDLAFWKEDGKKLVVAEVNHYGTSGSKPPAIAREYTDRSEDLAAAAVGFVWITDGLGWLSMKNPLRLAFQNIDYIVNVELAKEGQLAAALLSLFEKNVEGNVTFS